MDSIEQLIQTIKFYVDSFGLPVGEQVIPLKVIALLGTGLFLTVRLGFVQVSRLAHGFAVASGRYDDPNEPGDVSHFQALTTALSATVGIGNIAGAAWAIHYGGPGALFWMWMTALLGAATKFSEVTLAQQYREVTAETHKHEGTVAGGPMYYIERGLGKGWRWMAVFFAVALGFTAFVTGNAVQANTLADTMQSNFGTPNVVTGLLAASVVAAVILGGITRIGRVTGILAPLMAGIYVLSALLIILMNPGAVMPTLELILSEAFNPTAGVAGTGIGVLLVTLNWGVNRGLFSNEAGQGSAPIAHAAAKTDEPVSEGVVGLVEPFIDTIVIVTMTCFVLIITGVYDERVPSELTLAGGDLSYVVPAADGALEETEEPLRIRIDDGFQAINAGQALFAWHDVPVERFFTDEAQTQAFDGIIDPAAGVATSDDGTNYAVLYGDAPEGGAPLTQLGFQRGLSPLGDWGGFIVVLSVVLFAISTAISWSYYGDRCAAYLFGKRAILPYRLVYVGMVFLGTVIAPAAVWDLGDIALSVVILPNLLALVMLSGKTRELMKSYFARKPWSS
ncbi:MAG: sodium:alanine symporter family protein [Acidobacteria bacterium]|jgi:AGCS family alanine or glycine:cation symporter|nr:sodium:alanine symporter family protein [Acidobacteriota bacterium]MBQ02548.1 sodium:alanine symporter family protein [Acidobacteriota bacterium]MDP7339657.1 sodium:alanine symporter family protein [Vicinamibacterales bacterium]HJN44251.1 sodium:alanine symporter family protein [Vicinamibacterales bacterium]|tara:strand:+ start:9362 stop:11053 length:1692 start_codon:yes stop_codon:yes gene_type:complete